MKMNQFSLGEVATKVLKAKLSASGKEFILYSTIMGSIGALIPFETRQDVDFFVHLQMNLSIEAPSLCGRDFLSFRSMTDPIKNVIDGDLCEQFNDAELSVQSSIAKQLDRSIQEIQKKIEDKTDSII